MSVHPRRQPYELFGCGYCACMNWFERFELAPSPYLFHAHRHSDLVALCSGRLAEGRGQQCGHETPPLGMSAQAIVCSRPEPRGCHPVNDVSEIRAMTCSPIHVPSYFRHYRSADFPAVSTSISFLVLRCVCSSHSKSGFLDLCQHVAPHYRRFEHSNSKCQQIYLKGYTSLHHNHGFSRYVTALISDCGDAASSREILLWLGSKYPTIAACTRGS